jgi:hypothetical protein
MTQRFIIALTLGARRSGIDYDLERAICEHFEQVRIVERSYGGKSLTVEMPQGLAHEIRERLPFASVNPAVNLALL